MTASSRRRTSGVFTTRAPSTRLNLERNRLTALPESLGNLTALTTLDLKDNQLTALPQRFAELVTNGLRLGLANNPLPENWSNAGQASGITSVTAPPAAADTTSSEDVTAWPGELLDHVWMRLRSLFVPSVSLAAVLATANMSDSAAAVLQLYTWERDRLLTLAKGAAGAAITVLAGLIAIAIQGKVVTNTVVIALTAALVAGLLFWAGFLLTGLRRIAEEYTTALDLAE